MAIHTMVGGTTKDPEMKVEYQGAVLETREKNGYDDSDFYAIVWNGKAVASVVYATTRGWTYNNGATVDVTPEVMEKVNEYSRERLFEIYLKADRAAARQVEKGKAVRVTKGRKTKPGTEGVVFWIGEPRKFSYNGPTVQKLGIALDDEMETVEKTRRDGSTYTVEGHKNVAWVADVANVEVLDPEQYETPEAEIRAKVDAISDPWAAFRQFYLSASSGGYVVM